MSLGKYVPTSLSCWQNQIWEDFACVAFFFNSVAFEVWSQFQASRGEGAKEHSLYWRYLICKISWLFLGPKGPARFNYYRHQGLLQGLLLVVFCHRARAFFYSATGRRRRIPRQNDSRLSFYAISSNVLLVVIRSRDEGFVKSLVNAHSCCCFSVQLCVWVLRSWTRPTTRPTLGLELITKII